MANKPVDLSGELGPALAKAAGSITRAAKRLNLSDNSVRVWLRRDSYPPGGLKQLLQLAGMPDDLKALAKDYKFTITKPKRVPTYGLRGTPKETGELQRALQLMDERIDQFGRLYDQFGEDVRSLFGSMGRKDLFVYVALTEYPFEMSTEGWAEAGALVAKALVKGAHFAYLYPSRETSIQFLKFEQTRIPSVEEFTMMFDLFRGSISNLIEKELRERNKVEEAMKRLSAFACPPGPFLLSGHKYVLLKPAQGAAKALAKFPTGRGVQQFALHLPLDQATTHALRGFVRSVLRNSKDSGDFTALLDASDAEDQ